MARNRRVGMSVRHQRGVEDGVREGKVLWLWQLLLWQLLVFSAIVYNYGCIVLQH